MDDFKNQILWGNCLDLIPQLPDNSINAVITSPPYAEKRNKQYGGIPEKDYPDWFVSIMEALKPKLTIDGSVLVVIRSHVCEGAVSDYVLQTRLKVRQAGWVECEELIWYKPNSPPMGSINRPRRSFENILWFSQTGKPAIDLRAGGNTNSKRIGFQNGYERFGAQYIGTEKTGNERQLISGVSKTISHGTSRITDVFTAGVSENDKGIAHPATYPVSLCMQLVQTFSKEGDTILDPFSGSGSTLLAARAYNRHYIGMELSQVYVDLAQSRLDHDVKYRPAISAIDELFDSSATESLP
jgi:DNA modification methylase